MRSLISTLISSQFHFCLLLLVSVTVTVSCECTYAYKVLPRVHFKQLDVYTLYIWCIQTTVYWEIQIDAYFISCPLYIIS